jgi:hypothetical protein
LLNKAKIKKEIEIVNKNLEINLTKKTKEPDFWDKLGGIFNVFSCTVKK